MEFPREFEIEKAISKDETRYNLNGAQLDVLGKRLIATDGHMAAVVPVKIEPGDKSGLIPPEAITAARKAAKTSRIVDARIECFEGKCQVTLPSGKQTFQRPEAQFPDVDQVIPKYREGDKDTITIRLDANLLATLAKAIGTDGKVTLTFPAKADGDPFLVKPLNHTNEAFGVLMPCGKGK